MRLGDGVKRAAMTWRGERVRGFRPRPEKGNMRPQANPLFGGGEGGLALNLFTLERIVKKVLQ